MVKLLIAIYGLVSYLVGMAGLVAFILYVGAFEFLPMHVNSIPENPIAYAVLLNIALLLLFGVHHSVAARQSFKQRLTRFIPESAERSTYVLITGIIMFAFLFHWQTFGAYVWQSDGATAIFLFGVYLVGWIIAFVSTFLINHFELFGLQQVYWCLRDKQKPNDAFQERFFYELVRRPLQFGVLLGLWFAPAMSFSHLMLVVGMSIYIAIGLYYEEKDLEAVLGAEYTD